MFRTSVSIEKVMMIEWFKSESFFFFFLTVTVAFLVSFDFV